MDKIKLYKSSLLKVFQDNAHIFILIFICGLSFFLNFYDISKYGYGNEYYAATVKSMSKNFKNFFFVSFDPAGMISVDKPPLGLWIQTIFVFLFGYNGYSLMLPQALCGTGCCILIFIIASKNSSKICGLIASFIFSIIPAIVVIARNNTMDMQLIFVLLIAVVYLFKSIKLNKKRYLFLSMILIGLGFNIKMLQAYTVLPAFFLTYFIFSKGKFSLKLSKIFVSILILAAVSFSWMTVVDLYPSNNRPYIDNSKNNSVLELSIKYNGIDRILGKESGSNNFTASPKSEETNNYSKNSGDYIGTPSIFRLWISSLYGQISWLLILAIGSIIMYLRKIHYKNNNLEKAHFAFWVIWFLTLFIIFSFSGFFHRYYLSMLAPAIAVLCGIGISDYINNLKSPNKNNLIDKFIYFITVAITIGIEIIYIYNYPKISLILISIILIMICFSLILILSNIKSPDNLNIYLSSICLICSITIAPLYWCLTTISYVPNLTMPSAGPELADSVTNTTPAFSSSSSNTSSDLQNYLLKNYKKGSFLVIGKKSVDVSKYIINTGLPCYSYGGFLGTTQTLTLDKLKQYVTENKITYFLISQEDMNSDNPSDIISYVKENGKLINPIEYGDFKSLNAVNKDSTSSLQSISNIGGGYGSSLYLLNNN